jgi:plastocyanin/mono/diheme cytochrome c family protein
MGNSRNPGLLAITAGVALAVLFALLGLTGALDAKIGLGLAAICVVTAALVFLFYSRVSLIEKAGYGALIFVVALAFMLPAMLVTQQHAQAVQANAVYDTNLQRGAAIFGQYCSSCHGFQGNGKVGPKLNNNPDVNKLSDDDLRRIISAGVPNPGDLTKYSMPSWSDRYGGPLTDDDINYLIMLIRSSDPTYRTAQNLGSVNGFSYVFASLTNPTQVANFYNDLKGGNKPAPDQFATLTSLSTVHIEAVDNSPTAPSSFWGWQTSDGNAANGSVTSDIVIKAGTTVIWSNPSTAPHNVISGLPNNPDNKFPSDQNILAPGSSDTYSYTFNTPGEYPFYCGIHPVMVGWITVVS